MARVKHAPSSLKRRKRTIKAVKGQRGARSKLLKTAKEAGREALITSYIDRKKKKRNFRSLWITRINAACKASGMSYNKFISGLKKSKIELNRKMLAEIALSDPKGLKALIKKAGQ